VGRGGGVKGSLLTPQLLRHVARWKKKFKIGKKTGEKRKIWLLIVLLCILRVGKKTNEKSGWIQIQYFSEVGSSFESRRRSMPWKTPWISHRMFWVICGPLYGKAYISAPNLIHCCWASTHSFLNAIHCNSLVYNVKSHLIVSNYKNSQM